MTPRRGWFITLEGPEGCGKTTQLDLLANWLRQRDVETITTIEPGGEPIADRIRHMLLHDDNHPTARTELLLYLAARAQHVEKVITPALESGKTVLCARFSDSTFAYQGYARGLDLDFIRCGNDFATAGLEPHLTIVIDVPVEIGLGRQMDRNRMEAESVAFHQRVREGFLSLAKDFPKRVTVISGTGSIEEVHQRIVHSVEELIT